MFEPRMNKALIIALAAAVFSVALPGAVINHQVKKENKAVNQVPADFYMAANMSLNRNLSAKLSEEEKVKLCTGEWASNIYACKTEDTNDIAYNAVKKVEDFCYINNIYEFNDWYSYEAKAYKAIEASFGKYAAYFWEISLTKYDHTDTLICTVTEGGTLIELTRQATDGRVEVLYTIR